jgi:putative ABC transport system permease protein
VTAPANRIRTEIEGLLRDARVGVRSLARTPGYTAAVIAILAIAIGATTSLFSVVNAVLLRRLPLRDPERLVILWETTPALERMSVSYPDFLDWRERSRSFEGIAAVRAETYNLTGIERPERVNAEMFSAGALKLLGVAPALGREFTAEEDRPGGAPVALLHHDFWRTHLGGDPSVIGASVSLDGRPFTIIGVLPRGFRFPAPFEAGFKDPAVAVPLAQLDPRLAERGVGPGLVGIGRLAPGVTLAQARDEMDALGRALQQQYEETRQKLPSVQPVHDELVRDIRAKLLLLMGAVALVLLIALANVANLALARGTVRQRELAVRAALGAGRGRLVRQLLVESALLGLVGGALGLLLALWGVDALAAASPAAMPPVAVLRVDRTVLLFTMITSLASGVLFGLVPALTLSDARLNEVLRAASSGGGGRNRARAALVVVEVALAFVLLAGAGLTLRAFALLQRAPLGFDPRSVLTFVITTAHARYPTPERLLGFHERLGDRLRALPGVRDVGLGRQVPMDDDNFESGVKRREDPPPEPKDLRYAVFYPIYPGYLAAMRIPLLAGRDLAPSDGPNAEKVALVDEELAKRFFPGEDPLGRWISSISGKREYRIVGVVKHVLHFGPGQREETPYQMYVPTPQTPVETILEDARRLRVVIRTSVPPLSLVEAVRAEVAALDPLLPVYGLRTMDDLVAGSFEAERFSLALLGGFSALALLLAALGLYAVMTYAVTRRTHEIGVRMALGAQPSAVQRMVVAQGLKLAGGGLAVGALGALAAGRLGGSLVAGVRPLDPATYAAVALVLGAVAVAAAWLPARRATRVDPTVALREE